MTKLYEPNGSFHDESGYPAREITDAERRRREPSILGTHFFVSYSAACRYYADYGYADVAAAVNRKLAEKEICIGEPPIAPGEYRRLIDGGTRYAIVTP